MQPQQNESVKTKTTQNSYREKHDAKFETPVKNPYVSLNAGLQVQALLPRIIKQIDRNHLVNAESCVSQM